MQSSERRHEETPVNKETIAETNLDDMPRPELAGHMWRQQGSQLVCQSCAYQHSTFIRPNQYLAEIKDGIPVLKTR